MGSTPSRTFGSVGVAMATPFATDGSLDIDAARQLAAHLVDQGVDCIVLSGTTGESPTTHQPEKDLLVSEVVAEVGGRAKVIAGAGSNDTAHGVRIAKGAEKSGAEGLLIVSPYYSRPSQEGVYQHITAIADSTDLPVMVYDIPGRTGVKIADETFDRLAENPKIKAVKDVAGDLPTGIAVSRRTGLEYYSGDDALNLPWLTIGGSGIISVVGHIAGARYRAMVDAVDAGNYEEARTIDDGLHSLVNIIMGGGQGAVMAKEALAMTGIIPSATVRLPLVGAGQSELDALRKVLRVQGYLK
ncbi:MAG: 4-hydroxy-tetrahydrodipicolinate synthase [Flaviflexus sp.]|uniref:4-hydroxy-tetrahydrodipicolinate synthase n=1 Tax=Flaviflexus sp. TaxID=1969482 RepID=UPI00352E7337